MSNKPFLQACAGEKADRVPIWIMRQAGRYMPAYMKMREKHSFLDLCHTPELAAEVTMQPIREFGFDAAIIFSDILIPLEPMGIEVTFEDGRGPQLSPHVDTLEKIQNLSAPDFGRDCGFVGEALKLTKQQLPDDTALIGFAGAPWTLACYAVEGMGSRNYAEIKKMAFSEPQTLHRLLEKLADGVARYLAMQLEAGADAVQIFDSWADALSPADYMEFSYPYIRYILEQLEEYPQPKILFAKDAGAFIPFNVTAGADVLGVDWRTDMATYRTIFKGKGPKAWQGNLDPLTLLGDPKIMLERAKGILEANAAEPGFIFNLGHGITPPTPMEKVRKLVDFVHSWKA